MYDGSLVESVRPPLADAASAAAAPDAAAVDADRHGDREACDARGEPGCIDASPDDSEPESECDGGSADGAGCTPASPPASPAEPRPSAKPDSGERAPVPVDRVSDECPNDPDKALPGACGCNKPDTDSDLDGTADCADACPRDSKKTAAGSCGCGSLDADTDADGTADCMDACPRDSKKTAVGACGCGAADVDGDKDGTADCVDECPRDPSRTSAGMCGCGRPDPEDPSRGKLGCVESALLHRYSFDDSGNAVRDQMGGAAGTIVAGNDASQSGGLLRLSGDTGPGYNGESYVSLPPTAWPAGTSATFEVWIDWTGPAASGDGMWQRVFDFGNQVSGESQRYLCVTTNGTGGVSAEFSVSGAMRHVEVVSTQPLPQNVTKHLAVVVDGVTSTLVFYVDGARQGTVQLPAKLTDIKPTNLWLGRSNFDRDPAFFGSLHDLRIYGAALTDAELKDSYSVGPDRAFVVD